MMGDETSATSGWMPHEKAIAGYHDSGSGETEPAILRPDSATALRQLLGLATAAIAVASLYFAQDVLIPITLAVMLSFILSPVVNMFQRTGLWRAPAVIITVLGAIGVIGAMGTLIGTQAASLSINAAEYATAIDKKVQDVRTLTTKRIDAISKAIGGQPRAVRTPVTTLPQSRMIDAAAATAMTASRPPMLVEVAPPGTSPYKIAQTILAPIIGPLETLFIVLIVAIFVLMQKEDLRDRFIRVFGSGDLHRTTLALDDAGQRLSRYFLAQLAINSAFGAVVTLGLWMLGVPSPALWGAFAALCRFVPYIGAVLAAVGPIALGLALDPGWSLAVYIALFFVVTEAVLGYVVEPLLYGHSTGLSPVSVIIAAIFWTWMWGPIGLIMSTPLTLCLVVLGRHVKALEFFDVLLGDRPALTPVEGFYQRILADNADEALAQAEAMLGNRNLAAYYDDVVLEALKLAALDEARGTIDVTRIRRITRTMITVIDDLMGHSDVEPSAAISDTSVRIACVAGKGPFDDAVTAMLSQIFERRGLSPRIVAHQSVARVEIERLDMGDIDIIILSYLELSGSPAQLRFLIRRLRQKAPHATIVVGLWPEGEAALTDAAIQATLGADRYVSSLRAAVDAVIEINVGKKYRKREVA
jgi:predicted PurR-regulated permease PerM